MCHHLHGRQAPLAAKWQGCELGVPRPSWRIPVWEGSRNGRLANYGGYQHGYLSQHKLRVVAGSRLPNKTAVSGGTATVVVRGMEAIPGVDYGI